MNKEQAAREYLVTRYNMPDDVVDWSFEKAFSDGWDAGQRQLLAEAARDFIDYYCHSEIFKHREDTARAARAAWQAAKLSIAAELAAKDARIAELEAKLDKMTNDLVSREAVIAFQDEAAKEFKRSILKAAAIHRSQLSRLRGVGDEALAKLASGERGES